VSRRGCIQELYRIFDTIEPDEYGCHNYPTAWSGHYVIVTIAGVRKSVHRWALERKLGRPIKPALHTCDWKSCVNPDHLYEGTNKDNARDLALRHPETWDYMRDPNSSARLKLKSWNNTYINPGARARWVGERASQHWARLALQQIERR
jgi:hypothetical protein